MMELLQSHLSLSTACQFLVLLVFYIAESVLCVCPDEGDHWSGWWSYGGVSGPNHWGDRQAWSICKKGKNQSPINILPETLLYDPHLKQLHIEFTKVDGVLKNTKKDITFILNNSSGNYVNFTSGPLSYSYRLSHIKFHFSYRDSPGSEHRIDGKAFLGELHFIAYNAEIYANYTIASGSPRGLAVVAVFLTIGVEENKAFDIFREKFVTVEQKGACTNIEGVPIEGLIPKTDHYMTYSGSLTQPGCQETVTWIIYNKPLYLSRNQPRCGKTNVLVSDLVRHKPGCAATEDGKSLETSDLENTIVHNGDREIIPSKSAVGKLRYKRIMTTIRHKMSTDNKLTVLVMKLRYEVICLQSFRPAKHSAQL